MKGVGKMIEKKLYFCLIIGAIFLILSIFLWFIKKTAMLIVAAVVGGLFLARGGILYMAKDYVPPEVQEFHQEIRESDLPKLERKFKLPKIEYEEREGLGYGLDGAIGEYEYNSKLGEAIVDTIRNTMNK